MEKDRKVKLLSILALVLAITGMSIGFAAFSSTLSISSSAKVTPNSSDFNVGFYESNTSTLADWTTDGIGFSSSGGATGTSPIIDNTKKTLSGAQADFTSPGQSVAFYLYIGNSGEYDAYLRAVNFLNVAGNNSNVVCTPGDGATASLVEAACEAISMTITIGDTTITNTNTTISEFVIPKATFISTSIEIKYDSNGARADGPFTVEFGGISLDFSTVDYNPPTGKDEPVAIIYHPVSISTEGPGTVEGVTKVKDGETTTLYAIPEKNAVFITWTLDGSYEIVSGGTSSSTLELLPLGNVSVIAKFNSV